MNLIEITLPDGSKREYERGIPLNKVAQDIGKRLAKDAIGAVVNGKIVDLFYKLNESSDIKILTFEDDEGKEIFRHSAAHIMAQAVRRLFPNTKYAIGPAIKDGFFYDFEVEKPLTPDDLTNIENEMKSITQENSDFTRKEMLSDDAISYFQKRNDPYKVELIQGFKERGITEVSIYTQGDFTDLCTGPHIPNTSFLKSFKLLSIAGSYWKGDSKGKVLQRVYGTAFYNEKDLKSYLNRLEEAKKRDHRKIGKELDLFSFQDEGTGFPFWHAKGTIIYDILLKLIRDENTKRAYQEVKTPIILHESLWHASGHYDNFKENMYFTEIDNRDFAVKPMNCPGHCLIYKNSLHSYKELPLKISEFGLVHRHELSGVLHGLFRARNFTQDDAHIFCMESQLKEEIIELIEYTTLVYKKVGFDQYTVFIATRPEKSIGTDEVWKLATNALMDALKELNIPFKLKEGEGAFYGPKIEFNVQDCLERDWQCGTIQVDFSMPGRLGLTYEGSDGHKHVPVMIHRAILGSMERFIGILIEHYAGKFPLWLAPVQIKLVPILDKHFDYAQKIENTLKKNHFRVETDKQDEKLGYKIRKSQLEKIPFMVILGDNELEKETISVRSRDNGDLGSFQINDFIELLNNSLANNKIVIPE